MLLVIVTGAVFTSESLPLPGSDSPAQAMSGAAIHGRLHRVFAEATAVLASVFSVWLLVRERRARLRVMAGLVLIGILLECAVGTSASPGIFHAFLAPLLFSSVIVIAVLASGAEPGPAASLSPPSLGSPLSHSLRGWASAIPPVVLIQIGLGAAYRHDNVSVLWHILNAMAVISLVLAVSVLVFRMPPERPRLRASMLRLAVITGIQVFLGFAVFIVLLLSAENSAALVALSAVHVVTGTLTLAASIGLAMEVRL